MKFEKKHLKHFWQKIRFKYRLTFLNESTLEEVFSFRLSQLSAIIASMIISVIFIVIIISLLIGTPLKTLLPGYMDNDLRSELIDNNIRIDSLAEQNLRRELYLENIKNILSGNVSFDSIMPVDSVLNISSDSIVKNEILAKRTEREKQFVDKFEEEEKYNLTILSSSLPTDGLIFNAPVRGVISQKFDPLNNQFGLSILCAKNSSISTPLDGTIVYIGYTIEDGYVVNIQHSNDFVSIFKNLAEPIRKIGTHLTGGSVFGNVASDKLSQEQPNLNYQLWHKGIPVNPEEYINF
ncbi:MAG: M23 family metallopeptidase [Bacteroidales bacterium]|nr:M23 family metallopeptidase [Bacteroidales bacterium]